MFAFAIWDARAAAALLARDRLGKKPLFYAERDGVLSFASELRRAAAGPGRSRASSTTDALDAYLAYRYVPGAAERLPRGAQAAAGARRSCCADGRATIERYWRLDYARKRTGRRRARAARGAPRRHPRAVTRRRMIADVPLGAFLSGGVDSTAVVAAMAEASSEPVRRSRSASTHEGFDELPHARAVAERFGTEHHEFDRASRTRSRSCRGSCATTASRSPTPRRSRASTSREMARAPRHRRAQRRRRRRELRRLHALRRQPAGRAARRAPGALRGGSARAGRRACPTAARIDALAQPRAPARRRLRARPRPSATPRTCRDLDGARARPRSTRPSTRAASAPSDAPSADREPVARRIGARTRSTGCSTSTCGPTCRTTCW